MYLLRTVLGKDVYSGKCLFIFDCGYLEDIKLPTYLKGYTNDLLSRWHALKTSWLFIIIIIILWGNARIGIIQSDTFKAVSEIDQIIWDKLPRKWKIFLRISRDTVSLFVARNTDRTLDKVPPNVQNPSTLWFSHNVVCWDSCKYRGSNCLLIYYYY